MDLLTECTLISDFASLDLTKFDCRHEDLNDFFKSDAQRYIDQLIGKTYAFIKDENNDIVSLFTLSNDSLVTFNLPRTRKEKVVKAIPRPKRHGTIPAVKIGRLGINSPYQGQNVGSQVIDFIKGWFVSGNKTGCRLITVDAYNETKILKFYERNDFTFLIPDEEKEKKYLNKIGSIRVRAEALRMRIMFYDLMKIKQSTPD